MGRLNVMTAGNYACFSIPPIKRCVLRIAHRPLTAWSAGETVVCLTHSLLRKSLRLP